MYVRKVIEKGYAISVLPENLYRKIKKYDKDIGELVIGQIFKLTKQMLHFRS